MKPGIRNDPESFLAAARSEDRARGKLHVFLGMSAGVGKTYAMLETARRRIDQGDEVVVGVLETHGRAVTEAMAEGLPRLALKVSQHRSTRIEEFDLDACLRLHPDVVLIDELAHTNAPGSRHRFRYQDVEEVLSQGIDVLTTLNVQHLESRKDLVEQITGIKIRETVPDSVIENADQVELVDLPTNELLKRLADGKVYLGDRAERAMDGFFKPDYLTALREIALRVVAERVEHDLQAFGKTKADPWPTREKLLVAVSHSPHSQRLIRSTRRLAYNLDAPWIAAHVEIGTPLRAPDRNQLARNLRLAQELGAEVVTVRGNDVADGLEKVCVQRDVTQIVVGRSPARSILSSLGSRRALDRLIDGVPKVDVHVIRQEEGAPKRSLFPWSGQGRAAALWNTLWVVLGLTALGEFLVPWMGYRAIGFVYLLGVLGVGFASSAIPVLFCAALSAVAWNFLFIPPKFTFMIQEAEDLMMCLSYFVTAAIVGLMAHRMRRHEKLIREQQDESGILLDILRLVAENSDRAQIATGILARASVAIPGTFGVLMADLRTEFGSVPSTEKDRAVARWVMERGESAGWSTDTLSQADALYLPLVARRKMLGALAFVPDDGARLTPSQRVLLLSITSQLASALDRADERQKLVDAEKAVESERLYQTLLNSISHEIRTPLTTILGAASALSDAADPGTRTELSEELNRSCGRLNQVVENLLDITRLNSGHMTLKKEWHDLQDLIGVVLQRMEGELSRHRVNVELAMDLPLIEIDYRLFEHVLSNLLANAARNAPQGSEIRICVRPDEDEGVQISVEDEGPGVDPTSLPRLFEKFYRVPGSPPGGLGLGLSIAKSIVELHGGTIEAMNRDRKGARFVIKLPHARPPSKPAEQDG